MIMNSFDPESPAIISPGDFYGEARQLCNVCIVTFSHVIFSHVLETFPNEKAAEIHACNGYTPIHLLTVDGRKMGFNCPISARQARERTSLNAIT